ncbi:MAG: D-alanyl-D-alanine carboxypeptidase, partial [Pseudomonadota bacterium]
RSLRFGTHPAYIIPHVHGPRRFRGSILLTEAEFAMWKKPITLTCTLLLLTVQALAGVKEDIAAIARSGKVLVLDAEGNELVAHNADGVFSPASVAKIVTAWLAMEVLGSDYRFKTSFYLDENRVLYVRGGGDPFLVSEEFALLAPQLLEATGKEPFTGMVIDTSYFPDDLRIPGIEDDNEAYNALNVALAANFNTINAVRKGKSVRSAEKQTPITPLAIAQFQARAPNGRSRISLAQEDPSIGALYAAELIAAFVKEAGGSVEGEMAIGSLPPGLKPIYVHEQSRDLAEILRQMMIGSNNYIANQVFLEVGAQSRGGQASLEKSIQVADAIFAKHDIGDAIVLQEGSGISPENRFTAQGLAKVLDAFSDHGELMKRTKAGSRYKTGSIDGVRTLAGYAVTKEHGIVRFVISLGGNSGKTRFRVLRAIERGL